MGSIWPFIVGMMLSLSAFAQSEQNFVFQGQPHEHVSLERVLSETRHRTEMQDTTCTRQIPYQDRECGHETRYRQECSWIPPRQECGRRDERRCRDVTRYRQECTQGPSRTECRDFPGGTRCHTDRNGNRICEPAPPQRRCETIPGERVCRQVPYRDQECTTHSVPWCYEVPGRNDCRQVPYSEYVCRDVTRYRTETYACRQPVQIPYQVRVPVKAQLDVQFVNPTFAQEVPFTASLKSDTSLELKASVPSHILVGIRAQAAQRDRQGDEITVRQRMSVNLISAEELGSQVTASVTDAVLDLKAQKLSFTVQGVIERQDRVELVVEGRRRSTFSTIVSKANLEGRVGELNAILSPVGPNLTAVQLDLAGVNTSGLNDKVNFLMKLKHVKALPEDFSWTGAVPALESQKEATLRAIK